MAFGINGCRVVNAHVSIRVVDVEIERLPLYEEPAHARPLPRELARGILVKCVGLTSDEMTLWVNNHDLGAHSAQEFAAGVIFNPVSPSDDH